MGYDIELWPDDHIDFCIWLEGYYETIESILFLKLLKPDNVVLDVGANIGYYTILAVSQIGKNGRIFAFEPVNITFSRLKKNVGNIGFVETINAACGKDNGYVDIFVSDYRINGNSGCSRILQPLTDCPLIKEKTKIISLDSFLEEKNITKVDVVKIDTEGYELKVLLGMEKT